VGAVQVAVVDFTAADAPARFTRSLRETGFAVLVNHPLPWSLVDTIHREWAALFDSPAVHRYVFHERRGGFAPMSLSETAKDHTVRDLKEFFHVYDDGPFPTEVSDAVVRYRAAAVELARTLLGWVDDHTPPDVRARFSTPLPQMLGGGAEGLLRVLRYPPLPERTPEGAVRAAAHEDINLITVLPASDEPGLELLGTDGSWYPVPCDPGSVAVNAGEMLDLASGGYYPATTHRVVNPTGDAARRARMALPLFLGPAPDVVLADGKTADHFLQTRLRELRGERA
jgi:isopenicillin N synthase-like dioxygenase